MADDGLFPKIYKHFLERRDKVHGHDFEEFPIISAVPPAVTFNEKLRWWSFDRRRRMKKIRSERDRRLQEIVQLRTPPS